MILVPFAFSVLDVLYIARWKSERLDIRMNEIENISLSSKDSQYMYERQVGRMGNENGKRAAGECFLLTSIL